VWPHDQGGQSERQRIEWAQIRRAASRVIADQDLRLAQQRFRGDGADAAGLQESREGSEQVNREENQFAYGSNAITSPMRR